MTVALEDAARALHVSPNELWQESLKAYIARERRRIQQDAADFQDRYGVATPEELSQRIEQGSVRAHPAWEDLIEWESLVAQDERLDELAHSLS